MLKVSVFSYVLIQAFSCDIEFVNTNNIYLQDIKTLLILIC